jgi:hypothetical protein
MVLVFVVCMGLLGTQEKVYLWVFSCLTNAFAAPIWAGGLAWSDRYIMVSGMVLLVLNLGAGTSGLLFNYLTGWLFTNRDANSVMYLLFACSVIMCVFIVIMQLFASRHGDRYAKQEAEFATVYKRTTDYGDLGLDNHPVVLADKDMIENGTPLKRDRHALLALFMTTL